MSARGRRTIGKTFKESPEFGGFCGWAKVRKVLKTISDEKTLNLFIGYFATGARAMELPTLIPEQIRLDYHPEQIEIRNMYVSKWHKGPGYRTFHINKDNPVYKYFEETIEQSVNGRPLYPYSYNQIYYRICSIEAPEFSKSNGGSRANWCNYKGPWWAHRIRAEVACALIKDFGFNNYALKKWFGWRTDKMPGFYGDMTSEDVARMMRKSTMTLEITPETLSEMTAEQRDFVLNLLSGK